MLKSNQSKWWRWLIYAVVGFIFGIIDYYWEALPRSLLGTSAAMVFVLQWAPFLVPIIPVSIVEYRKSKSIIKSGFAGALCWCVAIVIWYLWQMIDFVFIGKSSRMEMHISNKDLPHYADNVKSLFSGEVMDGIKEWTPVALIGGFAIGVVIAILIKSIWRVKRSVELVDSQTGR